MARSFPGLDAYNVWITSMQYADVEGGKVRASLFVFNFSYTAKSGGRNNLRTRRGYSGLFTQSTSTVAF